MHGQTHKTRPSESPSHTKLTQIISEFQTDSHRYFVVLLSRDPDEHGEMNLLPSLQAYCEINRFEIQGHVCAVLEVTNPPQAVIPDVVKVLTSRELQITTLVALGWPNKKIAIQLHISEWTVSTHLRRIFAKLGVDSRAAMVYVCSTLIQPYLKSQRK